MTLPPNWQPPASFVKDGVTWTVGREVGDGMYECYRRVHLCFHGADFNEYTKVYRTFTAEEIAESAERSE